MGPGPAAGSEVTDKAMGLAACIVSGQQHPLSCSTVTRAGPAWGRQGQDIELPPPQLLSLLLGGLSLPHVPPALPLGSGGAVAWLGWGQTEGLVPDHGTPLLGCGCVFLLEMAAREVGMARAWGALPIPLGMHPSLLALGMWRTGAALCPCAETFQQAGNSLVCLVNKPRALPPC